MDIFTPKAFLKIGGIILLIVAILGFIGVIGPTEESLFGPAWYFDEAENTAHFLLGVVALILFHFGSEGVQKSVVQILGVLGILVGLFSLFGPVTTGVSLLGAQLQNPADTILHLIVGIWALCAGFCLHKKTQTM